MNPKSLPVQWHGATSPNAPCLCVFIKAPVLGAVKTRLAEALGAQGALDAYLEMTEHQLEALSGLVLPTQLWVEGDLEHPLVRAWSRRHGLPVRRQPAGDLGGKMHAAMQSCRAAGRPGIIVGSDAPEVDAAYVEDAAARLTGRDGVLGPAEDGGYVLIGLHRPIEALFAGIAWGTDSVLTQTRMRIAALGLNMAELPETWDLDRPQDWRRFLAWKARASVRSG